MALCLCVPITSRGKDSLDDVFIYLSQVHSHVPPSTEFFFAVDKDDDMLKDLSPLWLEEKMKLRCTSVFVEPSQPAPIVRWYNDLIKAALIQQPDKFDYFVLWGDDVEIRDAEGLGSNWFSQIKDRFQMYHETTGFPFGFGCVALNDLGSPGFPTFPVVHRTHVRIFGGFCPPVFYNQDADPFVFELYRRFGVASILESALIKNHVGGTDSSPRYITRHVKWKDDVLNDAINKLKSYILENGHEFNAGVSESVITIDVIVPTFRTDMNIITRMLDMVVPSKGVSLFFIIVVDDPFTLKRSQLKKLESRYLGKVRVRFQEENSGASAARNRGLDESAAEWVLFLDDDVEVSPTLICSYVEYIRNNGKQACGYIGLSLFPEPKTPNQAAFQMSYLAFFWDIASRMQNPPWGVTANLLLKRTPIRFHLDFVKTGGGEDIAMCIDSSRHLKLPLFAAPNAAILHPYWEEGDFSPWRFFNWTQGDGLLIDKYPELTYLNFPNVIELSILLLLYGSIRSLVDDIGMLSFTFLCGWFLWIWSWEVVFDVLHLLCKDKTVGASYTGHGVSVERLKCAIRSTYIKNHAELGHFWVHAKRGMVQNICYRFDWFCGMNSHLQQHERLKHGYRFFVFVAPVFGVDFHGPFGLLFMIIIGIGGFLYIDQ